MLPAFGDMRDDLATSIENVQMSIPVFAVTLAVSQLFFGPLSDRFGRRISLIVGLSIYVVGAILAAIAPSIELVLAGRALQGFGSGAPHVLGRAILRDCNTGPQLARAMALAMSIFSVGPIFAPLFGYGFTSLGSWRLVFVAMLGLSLFLAIASTFWFRETNNHMNKDALSPKFLARAIGTVFGNWQSRTFIMIAITSYCALLSFIANAPRLYDTAYGIRDLSFALLFASTGLGIVIGQVVNRLMLKRYSIIVILRLASFVLFLASAMIVIGVWQDLLSAVGFTAMMFFFNTSFLVVISNITSLVIDPHQSIAGVTSAILGSATLFGSGVYVATTLPVFQGDILRWAIGMLMITGLTFFWLMLVQKNRISFEH